MSLYRQPGMLMYWTHEAIAPWQTEEWKQQMREQLRPNAYLRMIENRWVSGESTFIDLDWWDRCTDAEARPIISDPSLPVWVGVDASVKRDSTAIVVCSWNEKQNRVCLVWHRIFQPTPQDPLNFEDTIEETLLDLANRFTVEEIKFDPFQMISTAQRLQEARLPMLEFAQTVPNLTAASSNLFDLIKSGNLISYPDTELRLALSRTVALETSRGWRIAKQKTSHKIDVVVALAMAALAVVEATKGSREVFYISPHELRRPENPMPREDFFGESLRIFRS